MKNGSIDFESFDADGLISGMTDNVFDVRYKDALNGEVERLLRQMQGVHLMEGQPTPRNPNAQPIMM